MDHGIKIGKMKHGNWKGNKGEHGKTWPRWAAWDSFYEEFLPVIKGEGRRDLDLAMWFRLHPVNPEIIAELEKPLQIPWEHTTEPFDGATRLVQSQPSFFGDAKARSLRMTSVKDHPVVAWIGFVLGLVSAVLMVAGGYIYGENLQRSTSGLHEKIVEEAARISKQIETRNLEKKALDRDWLQADSEQSQAIRAEIRILRERLNVDASLMYQLGLHAGKQLCLE